MRRRRRSRREEEVPVSCLFLPGGLLRWDPGLFASSGHPRCPCWERAALAWPKGSRASGRKRDGGWGNLRDKMVKKKKKKRDNLGKKRKNKTTHTEKVRATGRGWGGGVRRAQQPMVCLSAAAASRAGVQQTEEKHVCPRGRDWKTGSKSRQGNLHDTHCIKATRLIWKRWKKGKGKEKGRQR